MNEERTGKCLRQVEDRVNVCVLIKFLLFQQSRCVCLKNTSIHGGHIHEHCDADSSDNCLQDQNAICAVNNTVHKFALYKKGN
jgi:hypothetical protein